MSISVGAPRTCVLAIDGRSGSGKTTFAGAVAAVIGAQIVHVEDFYPGWDGLRAGAAYLAREVLAPLRAGQPVTPRRYNWHTGEFVCGQPVHPGLLVVEGCGALSRGSRPLIDFGVWLTAEREVRRERATKRDGDASWWESWAQTEEAFYAVEHSRALADAVLTVGDGVASVLAVLREHGWDGAWGEGEHSVRGGCGSGVGG